MTTIPVLIDNGSDLRVLTEVVVVEAGARGDAFQQLLLLQELQLLTYSLLYIPILGFPDEIHHGSYLKQVRANQNQSLMIYLVPMILEQLVLH